MFLRPLGLEYVRVDSLISLVPETRLGLVCYPHKISQQAQGNSDGLGIVRVLTKSLAFILLLLLLLLLLLPPPPLLLLLLLLL